MSMAETNIYSIAVIGGGAAGVMGASYALSNNDDVVLFPGSPKDRKKSRAFWVSKIENMPGLFSYKKGIADPNKDLIKKLTEGEYQDALHLAKNRGVVKLSKESGIFHIEDNKGDTYKAKYVLLTTGVMDVQPYIDGSMKAFFPYANIQLIDYCLICDGHHVHGKRTTVIGHGAGAAWVSVMLHERYHPPEMKILTNGNKPEFNDELWELLNMYKIEVIETKIKEVVGKPKESILEGYELEDDSFVASDFSFVSLGMIVYNDLVKDLDVELDNRGFIKADKNSESSLKGLFVAGDIVADKKNQIYTSWDTSVNAITEVNRLIREDKN